MKKKAVIILIILLGIGIIFQFFITWHRANDHTMEATIKEGDLLWINKAATGAYFLGMQMPAMCNIERNDVVYFAYPQDYDSPLYDKKREVSRVVGLPGDRVQIKRKEVFVNGEKFTVPDSMQFGYRLILKEDTDAQQFFQQYQIKEEKQIVDSLNIYQVPLTAEMADVMRKKTEVDYLRLIKKLRGGANRIFPKSKYRSWSEDDFGPLRVPSKGDVVKVDYRNYRIYKDIIVNYEGNKVMLHKGKLFINGKEVNSYTIKNNYYFVLDDNRDRFFDSREWGFVPEQYILGKVINAN